MRKNSANILRESPDPYRLSPASLLNQQNRAQIYHRSQSVMSELNSSDDYTTSSARSSPIQIEDYRDGLIRKIDLEKLRCRNGQTVCRKLIQHESQNVQQVWDSMYYQQSIGVKKDLKSIKPARIYHDQIRQVSRSSEVWSPFEANSYYSMRLQDSAKKQKQPMITTTTNSNESSKKIWTSKSEGKIHRGLNRGYSMPMMFKSKKSGIKSSRMKLITNSSRNINSCPPLGKLTARYELPGFSADIHNSLEANSFGSREKLMFGNKNSSRSVRLPPNELKKFNLKPQLEELARSYFFNPGCLTFTPFPIYDRNSPYHHHHRQQQHRPNSYAYSAHTPNKLIHV